jgi:hypothetical protein
MASYSPVNQAGATNSHSQIAHWAPIFRLTVPRLVASHSPMLGFYLTSALRKEIVSRPADESKLLIRHNLAR